ncbi:MAG: hypothetical protein OQL09_03735 [Gammaproteobacteria bacterium]|nr:hypothetical protein [Gammaproteobacteria bacterium]
MRLFLSLLLLLFLVGCSEEQQNRLSRIGVSWLEGNYRVTFAEGSHLRSWTVLDGKVTSEPGKGYYFFWATENGKKFYVQTPIERSYIEELP